MAQPRQAQSPPPLTPGARTGHVLSDLLQDLRFGARSLRRRPGFTAVAVAILTLAIGANTAIFSIVNGVVLRPLPYPRPGQLMYLSTQFPTLGFMDFVASPPEYLDLRQIAQSYSELGAFRTAEANLTAGTRALRVRSASVDEHLLNVLGVPAEYGRLFAAGETDVAGPPRLGPVKGRRRNQPRSPSCRTSCGRRRSADDR